MSPASFTFAFPAGDEVSFGEKVFSHFALKVIHYSGRRRLRGGAGVPSHSSLCRGQGLGFTVRLIWVWSSAHWLFKGVGCKSISSFVRIR